MASDPVLSSDVGKRTSRVSIARMVTIVKVPIVLFAMDLIGRLLTTQIQRAIQGNASSTVERRLAFKRTVGRRLLPDDVQFSY
jgi:hypothetical protein